MAANGSGCNNELPIKSLTKEKFMNSVETMNESQPLPLSAVSGSVPPYYLELDENNKWKLKTHILIVGFRCTGKTRKFNEIISEISSDNVLAIDGLNFPEEIEAYLINASNKNKFLVATMDYPIQAIPSRVLSFVHVIHCVGMLSFRFADWVDGIYTDETIKAWNRLEAISTMNIKYPNHKFALVQELS